MDKNLPELDADNFYVYLYEGLYYIEELLFPYELAHA